MRGHLESLQMPPRRWIVYGAVIVAVLQPPLFKLGQGENETFGKCADKICGGYYHQSCGLQYCNRKGTEHVHCGLCNTDLGAASSVMRDLCSDAALRQTILYRAEVAQKIEDSL
eukprot:COSAG06_NODE_29937_length_548_cov_0.585746_1_plen_113_part_10